MESTGGRRQFEPDPEVVGIKDGDASDVPTEKSLEVFLRQEVKGIGLRLELGDVLVATARIYHLCSHGDSDGDDSTRQLMFSAGITARVYGHLLAHAVTMDAHECGNVLMTLVQLCRNTPSAVELVFNNSLDDTAKAVDAVSARHASNRLTSNAMLMFAYELGLLIKADPSPAEYGSKPSSLVKLGPAVARCLSGRRLDEEDTVPVYCGVTYLLLLVHQPRHRDSFKPLGSPTLFVDIVWNVLTSFLGQPAVMTSCLWFQYFMSGTRPSTPAEVN